MKIAFVLFLLALVSCNSRQEEATIKSLSPREFQQKLAATPNAVLMDVRSFAEVREEYIKGQTNFDFKSEGFKTLVAGLDKSKPYFVYCAGGVRSSKAAEMMEDMGFQKIYTLDGGIKAWKAEGLPTRKLN